MRRDDVAALVAQRDEAHHEALKIHKRAEREQRSLTDAEQGEWDAHMREFQRLTPQVDEARVLLAADQAAQAASGGERRSTARLMTTGLEPDTDHEFTNAIRDVKKGETRALSTAVSTSAGTLSNVLFDRLRAASVVLASGIRQLSIEGDSTIFPSITADASPSWTSESATITPSDPTFSTVTAVPRKLAALVQVSNELIEDSDPSVVETLRDHLLKVLGLKVDAGLLEGTGTPPQPSGLLNLSGKQTLAAGTNGATVTFDMIADAIALLEAVNVPRERMRIVAHPRNLAALRKANASTAGSYLWQDVGSAEPGTVFGVPIYSTSQLTTTETQGSSSLTNSIYVYDIESLVFVDRRPFTFEVDRARLFNSDQAEIRAKLRADLISPTPTGVVRINGVLA